MIESIAEKIALRLKEMEPEHTTSAEIMKYGIIVGVTGFFVIIFSLCIGLFGGKLLETLYALSGFAIFRFFSGGFHFSSIWTCIVLSTALFTLVPYIPISGIWIILLTVIALILTAIYAPSDMKNHSRIPAKYYPLLKIISIAIVLSNFNFLSPILANIFLAQSFMLIKFREVKN